MATVLGEEGQKAVHRLEARGVNHRAAVTAHRDKARDAQSIEMERERVGREPEPFSDLASRHPIPPRLDKQAEDIKAVVLREGSQSRHGVGCFHISTNIQLFPISQVR